MISALAPIWASVSRSEELPVLVFDGDSIAVGAKATPGKTLAEQTVAALGGSVRIFVVGHGGNPVTACLKRYSRNVAPLYRPGTPNVIFFHAGDNDIARGRTAEETYAALTEYVQGAQRDHWRIVVSTEMIRPGFPNEKQRELAAYNGLIRSNSARADGVADFQADPIMGNEAQHENSDYYSRDHIHPTDGGYAILARIAAASLSPLLR